jgi:multidrug efflux pump subunit AcrB
LEDNVSRNDEMRGPIAWMARNPVAANLIMLACLIGGLISMQRVKQEVFPDFELDLVRITVAYPGASPEEVEQGVLLAIEEAVSGLDGVKEVTSQATEGMGRVTVDLLSGADGTRLAQEIKSEVDRITTFPKEAEEPKVRLLSHRREVLNVIIYGDAHQRVLHELAQEILDELLEDPSITQVEISGVPPMEISIEIPQEELRRYGLTLEEVAERIRRSSVDVPGGGIKTHREEILVRVKERREYGREFAQLAIITAEDGSRVTLGQIARIRDGYEEARRYTTYNGHPAVILDVYRVGSQTPIEVSRAVRRKLKEISKSLPPGIGVTVWHDRSDIYRQRVELLLRNGTMGLILVLILLGIFLERRLAFWVMMGIPISFLGTLLVLPITGVSINMVSLFAFIVALGIVVDDAIVVGENTYRYRQEGLPPLAAAVRGAREVAMPVTFSILTNIAAFLPLYFVPGTLGKIFRMIPIVVCVAFLISLMESLFVLPAHLGHQRRRLNTGPMGLLSRCQRSFSAAFSRWVERRFVPLVSFATAHRYATLILACSVLLVMISYALSGRMGFSLFPKIESDFSQVKVILPFGSPIERTQAVVDRLTAAAREFIRRSGHKELLRSIISDVGINGTHTARVRVELAGPNIRSRTMSTEEFTRRWREAVGEIPGVEALLFASDVGGPGSRGRPVAVELSHRDIRTLQAASRRLSEALRLYPMVKDVDDGFELGKSQFDVNILPEGRMLGLTAQEVGRQLRSAFHGAEALRQQRGRNEIKVMVRLPLEERSSEHILNELLIRTPDGVFVPLKEVARIKRVRSYTSIERRNGRRVVQVSAEVVPRGRAGEVLTDLKERVLPQLIRDYPGLTYSFEGHQASMRESLGGLRTGFMLAVLAIYALLAIPFRSFSQPFVVMSSIPFGIVGAVLGHMLMGYDLSIPSIFGIVALSGVVVNDSLVLIEFANRKRREASMTPRDAIIYAAMRRFRPVILTTLTTFGGLAPMIFETSRQARFLIPMALSLGFGLLVATFITLLIVPSLYLILEDATAHFERARGSMMQVPSPQGE